MKLDFGVHKGKELSDLSIPDDYLKWLANRGKYTLSGNRFITSWKVPVPVWMEARMEMERRGYRHIGERFEKNER